MKKAWEGSQSSLSQGLDGLGGDATSATPTNNCHSLLENGANQVMMDMICARTISKVKHYKPFTNCQKQTLNVFLQICITKRLKALFF